MMIRVILAAVVLNLIGCVSGGEIESTTSSLDNIETFTTTGYIALSGSPRRRICGAVIVDSNHILTSGNCIEEDELSGFQFVSDDQLVTREIAHVVEDESSKLLVLLELKKSIVVKLNTLRQLPENDGCFYTIPQFLTNEQNTQENFIFACMNREDDSLTLHVEQNTDSCMDMNGTAVLLAGEIVGMITSQKLDENGCATDYTMTSMEENADLLLNGLGLEMLTQ